MDLFGKKEHPHGDTIINIDQIIVNFGEEKEHHHQRKMHPRLAFNTIIQNTNFNYMAVISSLTLTTTAPVQLFMTVLDSSNGNALVAGALTGLSYTPADPTQDLAVVDPAVATDVDIHAVSATGGTVVTANGTFVSTLLKSDNVTPVFSGPVTGTLTIVNNVVVSATMTPVLAFNQ
jgi:hypothetical protein